MAVGGRRFSPATPSPRSSARRSDTSGRSADTKVNGTREKGRRRRPFVFTGLTNPRSRCIISVTDISIIDAKEQTMTETTQNPDEFLPLTPAVFNILLALADGEKHGYGIMQEV